MAIPGSGEQFKGHVEAKKAGDQPKGTEGLKRQLSESIFGKPEDRREAQEQTMENIRDKSQPVEDFIESAMDDKAVANRQEVRNRVENLSNAITQKSREIATRTLSDADRQQVQEINLEIQNQNDKISSLDDLINRYSNDINALANSTDKNKNTQIGKLRTEIAKLEGQKVDAKNIINRKNLDKSRIEDSVKDDNSIKKESSKQFAEFVKSIDNRSIDEKRIMLREYVKRLALNEYNNNPNAAFNLDAFKQKYLTNPDNNNLFEVFGVDNYVSAADIDFIILDITEDSDLGRFDRAEVQLIDMIDTDQNRSLDEILEDLFEDNDRLTNPQREDLEKKIQELKFERGEMSMREVMESNLSFELQIDYLENFYEFNERDFVETLQLLDQLNNELTQIINKANVRSRLNQNTINAARYAVRVEEFKKKIVADAGIRMAERLGNDFDNNVLQTMKDQLIVLDRELGLGIGKDIDATFDKMVGKQNEDGSLVDWFQQQRAIKVYDNLEAQLANGDISLADLSGKGNAFTGELKRLVDSNQISEALANKVRDELKKQVLEVENIKTEESEHTSTMDSAIAQAIAQEKGLTDDEKKMMKLQAEGIKMLSEAETDYLARAYRGIQEKILDFRKGWINAQKGFVKLFAAIGAAGMVVGGVSGIAALTPFAFTGAGYIGLLGSGIGIGALVMSYKWNQSRVSNVYKYQQAVATMNQQAVMRGNIMRASTVYEATQKTGVSKDLIKAGLREKNIDPGIMDKVKTAKEYLNYINEQIIGTSNFLGDNQRRRFNLA